MIECKRCEWNEIELEVRTYFEQNKITVDSYWEDHVLASHFYQFILDDEPIGFFAIYEQSMITLFYVRTAYAHHGQSLFARIKQFEQVTNAFVATGDEFFLSHCMDNFLRIEKQAYFSIYTDRPLKSQYQHDLTFREAKTIEDTQLFTLSEDFFEAESAERVLNGSNYYKVYLVEKKETLIGFGVIEYGRVVSTIGSVGMYVLEEKRQQGYAACILKHLQGVVESKGLEAHSGCWYYNHNSKKSMESAGLIPRRDCFDFIFKYQELSI
ncbi:N-acetyltransferase [Fusibacter ferrireducens]|uniref:N-acetyltransferase n=1 Tax=Fusibacter ferrireducens TaxID=2785058 RepID=A0ABR9ZW19_9FIRM|nr:N-acetyltransferase [Fusibacter ferrireducens]MBF4694662.1 N-acetyltransferase [Fusibacter ferrireducens]